MTVRRVFEGFIVIICSFLPARLELFIGEDADTRRECGCCSVPSSDNLKSKNSWWLQKLTLRIILHTYTNHQTWSFGCRNMNLTKHFNVSIIPTPPTTQLHLSTSTPASVRMSLVPDFNISWLHFKLYPFIGHNLQWNCYNFRPEHCGRTQWEEDVSTFSSWSWDLTFRVNIKR